MSKDVFTAGGKRVDKTSPVPFYFQLAGILRDEIRGGSLQPGEELPSEQELCAHFNVSRTTVRQALSDLTAEGYVTKAKGQRSKVAAPSGALRFVQSSIGLFAEGGRIGQAVTSEVLRQEQTELPDWVSHELEVEPGSSGVVIERVRSVGGDVTMHVVNYLVEELARTVLAMDLRSASLYGLLKRAGVTAFNGRRLLEAVAAPANTAELLGVDRGAPLVRIESVTWDESGRAFECYEAWQRTDVHRIEVHASSRTE